VWLVETWFETRIFFFFFFFFFFFSCSCSFVWVRLLGAAWFSSKDLGDLEGVFAQISFFFPFLSLFFFFFFFSVCLCLTWFAQVILVIALLAACALGRDFMKELKECKDKSCLKSVSKAYKTYFKERTQAFLAEEHVLNEMEFADKVAKCEKGPAGDVQLECLRAAREKEARRKFSLLKRAEYERAREAKKKCKKLRMRLARKVCKKNVKLANAKQISFLETQMVDMVGHYTLADTKEEAAFAALVPLAAQCKTATCQKELATDRCPADPASRRHCTRLLISVPISSGFGLGRKFCLDLFPLISS
jgi:hypothetical protein